MTQENNDKIDFVDRLRACLDEGQRAKVDRMDGVRSKYLRTERDDQVDKALSFLVDRGVSSLAMNEGRALVVLGESGAGKTTMLDRALRRHPAFEGYGVRGSGCPLVSVDVPSPCTLKQLGRETLRVLGYPLSADRSEHVTWELVREKLEMLDVHFLHFDEAHNVVRAANVVEAERVRNTLKNLLNARSRPVSLILSGTPDLARFLGEMAENRRRTRFLPLRSLSGGDVPQIAGMVADLAEVAGLAVEGPKDQSLAPRLIHAALGQLGAAIEMTHEAIYLALREDATALRIEHYAEVFVDRTGNSAAMNPFVAQAWADIDCGHVVADGLEQDDFGAETQIVTPKVRARRKRKAASASGRGGN